MTFHGRSIRKRTGGRLRPHRKKRYHEKGRPAAETELGEERVRTITARGGTEKYRALALETASVTTEAGETVAATIEDVVENPANPNYARRNIITKGAVIETSEGRARVTSRPGQDGQVNAVLID
ncbi:MAG: 30S ribosomal protein S8e [Halobacteriota archaeon]